jgi:hypothetical protein
VTYPETSVRFPKDYSYLFLSTYNIDSGKVFTTVFGAGNVGKYGTEGGVYPRGYADRSGMVNNQSKIYDGGGANVLFLNNVRLPTF